MLTQIKNRTVTNDVDVAVIRPDATSESYRIFKGAVTFVAHDEGLDPSWLSTNMEDFLRIAGPLPRKLRLWKRFGPLSVYVPPRKFILAHKLVAGREKDQDDIHALLRQLRIRTRTQAQQILDTYIRQDIQAINHVEDTLDIFF